MWRRENSVGGGSRVKGGERKGRNQEGRGLEGGQERMILFLKNHHLWAGETI